MGLWVAFGFGAAVGALIGYLLGRQKQQAPLPPPARAALPPKARPTPSEVKPVVLDEGSANVLNALNTRLAAIGALDDLLHGSPLDPERARALVLLHGEVRRAAEITSHFLELAAHPAGAAEPCDAAVVINGVLAERESTFRELGVKVMRSVPGDLPMVACPMAQLTEMLTKLLDFSLRRLPRRSRRANCDSRRSPQDLRWWHRCGIPAPLWPLRRSSGSRRRSALRSPAAVVKWSSRSPARSRNRPAAACGSGRVAAAPAPKSWRHCRAACWGLRPRSRRPPRACRASESSWWTTMR